MAFSLAMIGWGSPVYAKDLERDFEDLLERCRASVEANSTFDSSGLREAKVAKSDERRWGDSTKQKAWILPESELYVVLTEWTFSDGTIRHLCDVSLINEERVLDKVEQGLLLRAFLIKQGQMIGAGTHEIDRRLSPIPPIINAAFLLSERNPNGCIVTNHLALSPDGTFFSAGAGEQAKRCEKD